MLCFIDLRFSCLQKTKTNSTSDDFIEVASKRAVIRELRPDCYTLTIGRTQTEVLLVSASTPYLPLYTLETRQRQQHRQKGTCSTTQQLHSSASAQSNCTSIKFN